MAKAPTIEQLRMLALRVKLRRTSGVPGKSKKCILLRNLINPGNRRCYTKHWKAREDGRGEETKRSYELEIKRKRDLNRET